MATKKLGKITYPKITVTEFNGARGTVDIQIADAAKSVTIQESIFVVRDLVNAARAITERQRSYAIAEWNNYLELKKLCGYTNPNDGLNP